MERLTKRVDGIAVLESWAVDKDPVSVVQRLCSALAAYEDTGLEPEQVMELKSFTQGGIHKIDDGWSHVQELLQAEQDSRLVVLPCKVGEYWRDWNGDRVQICSISYMTRRCGKELCEALDTAISSLRQQETVTDRHQMTNADRIRAMRDEEIAEAASFRFCPSEMIDKSCVFRNCKECWIEWLQQPAEEADNV